MKSSLKFLLILFTFIIYIPNSSALNYDPIVVKNKWLEWTNNERFKYGLSGYKVSETLNQTALSWSAYSIGKGYIDHKRQGQKAYYDYNKIGNWFSSKGVVFQKIGKTTFSESIGWNVYSCNKADCTENLVNAVRKTFDLYMREKGKKYQPHYSSIINKNFSMMGIGIAIDEIKHRYYLTVHYGTQILAMK